MFFFQIERSKSYDWCKTGQSLYRAWGSVVPSLDRSTSSLQVPHSIPVLFDLAHDKNMDDHLI